VVERRKMRACDGERGREGERERLVTAQTRASRDQAMPNPVPNERLRALQPNKVG